MRLSNLKWENVDHKALATAYHIYVESLLNYDLHMLMIDGLEPSEEYRRIVSDLTNISFFFQLLFKFGELVTIYELDIDDERLIVYLEKIMGRDYRDYVRVTRKMLESSPDPLESSDQSYLSLIDFFKLRSRNLISKLGIFWDKAIKDLENSESDTIRLWREVFESDEGEKFLIRKYPNYNKELKLVDYLTVREYEDIFPILIEVPDKIATDEYDFTLLYRRANSIACGLGLGLYKGSNNWLVMDPNEKLRNGYLSRVISFNELMRTDDDKFKESSKSRSSNWDLFSNDEYSNSKETEITDKTFRKAGIPSGKNPSKEKWRLFENGKEVLFDENGNRIGVMDLEIDEELTDNGFVRLDKDNETDEEDDSYDIERDHSDYNDEQPGKT